MCFLEVQLQIMITSCYLDVTFILVFFESQMNHGTFAARLSIYEQYHSQGSIQFESGAVERSQTYERVERKRRTKFIADYIDTEIGESNKNCTEKEILSSLAAKV